MPLLTVVWCMCTQVSQPLNPCTALHEMTRVMSWSTNLLDMSIVVLGSSFRLKWVPTTLVGSQWFSNLLSNQAWASSSCPSLIWQKIQEPLTQDNCAVQGLTLHCSNWPKLAWISGSWCRCSWLRLAVDFIWQKIQDWQLPHGCDRMTKSRQLCANEEPIET